MIAYPLSRRNSLILAAIGLIIVALFSYAAVRNAHADARANTAHHVTSHAKFSQDRPATEATSDSSSDAAAAGSVDQGSSGVNASAESSNPVEAQSTANTFHAKPGLEPGDKDIPDPDKHRPSAGDDTSTADQLIPPTRMPAPTNCIVPLHPGIASTCVPYTCKPVNRFEPANPVMPTMIACPIVYKSE